MCGRSNECLCSDAFGDASGVGQCLKADAKKDEWGGAHGIRSQETGDRRQKGGTGFRRLERRGKVGFKIKSERLAKHLIFSS